MKPRIVILLKPWLLLACISTFFSFSHPFHASITQCIYNPENQSLEITMRLFTDDLGSAVGEEITGKTSRHSDSLIAEYVSRNFALSTLQKQDLKAVYLGRETELDLTYVFLEIPSFPLKDVYTVRQTVFFDRFDDQTNIVNIETADKSGSGYFTKGETTKTIHLQ